MRLLLVSDLHYSLPQLDWVVGASSSFDVVAVAGDSLNISSPVPLDVQSVVVQRYLTLIASGAQLLVSSGNHDLTGPDAQGEQSALWLREMQSLGMKTDGDSVLSDDTLITICPWWDGPLGRAEVAAQLAADAARRPAHLGLAVSLATDRLANVLDRPPRLWRPRCARVDRTVPT